MKNTAEDTKMFSKTFKKAIEKSEIRKTTQEKEAKQLADRFAEQTKRMASNFERRKNADSVLPVVYQSLNQLDKLIRDLNLGDVVTSDFQKVKSSLDRIAEQFSFKPPVS